MLHSGQSFPGTPALPCSTTGTGPVEEAHKCKVLIPELFYVLFIFSSILFISTLMIICCATAYISLLYTSVYNWAVGRLFFNRD